VIVVDTNVIAYLHLPSDRQEAADALFRASPVWAAPRLWRSEFRNVLATCVRHHDMTWRDARDLMSAAHELMQPNEYEVGSDDIFSVMSRCRLSAYDAEFVALAMHLEIPLVTEDTRILDGFPKLAHPMESMAR